MSEWLREAVAYDENIASLFDWHRNNLLNAAGVTLKEAGWTPPDMPPSDEPPGGMDALLWGSIYHAALLDSATAFAEDVPDEGVQTAIKILSALRRVAEVLALPSPGHMGVADAGFWLMAAMSYHLGGKLTLVGEAATTAGTLDRDARAAGGAARQKNRREWYWQGAREAEDVARKHPDWSRTDVAKTVQARLIAMGYSKKNIPQTITRLADALGDLGKLPANDPRRLVWPAGCRAGRYRKPREQHPAG